MRSPPRSQGEGFAVLRLASLGAEKNPDCSVTFLQVRELFSLWCSPDSGIAEDRVVGDGGRAPIPLFIDPGQVIVRAVICRRREGWPCVAQGCPMRSPPRSQGEGFAASTDI
jgi:hypothetical protein